jgi:F0F1-type ATP synthase assembly protein I
VLPDDDLTLWGHRTSLHSHIRSSRSLRRWILALRFGAVITSALILWLISEVTAALPWQLDGTLALLAALAFAYKFERQSR